MASTGDGAPAKRSRVESPDDRDPPAPKRPTLEENVSHTEGTAPGHSSLSPSQLAQATEIITREFSTEILLKHNELRLIDTEIAKCQVALEQLRRAKLIPYPFQTANVQDMLNVSSGTGPALVPAGLRHPPSHPAPWGVTDGPYTRRYSDWLIHSPEFDGGPRYSTSRIHAGAREGPYDRRTRGQQEDPILISGRSRTQRGSTNARLQALPLGYPQPKGSRGPLTLKRQSDGKWVKLVCQNCQREDFSSVQGFINHCRISHQVHFVTHEDAAQRAGTEGGVDQGNGEVSGSVPSVQSGAASTTAPVAANITSQTGNVAASSDLVHKYNRYAVAPHSLFPAAPDPPPKSPSSFKAQREKSRRESNMGPPVSPGFVPSSLTPHLSSLFAKTGRAGNLDALVKEARTREVIEPVVSPMSPDTGEQLSPTPLPCVSAKHHSQGGLSGPTSATPTSMKGPGRIAAQSSSSTILRATMNENLQATPINKPTSPMDISPSVAAVDTNQAPSLVSDDGQSGSDGEYDEERPSNTQQSEPQARISNVDSEDDMLQHESPEGPSTMEVEEKIQNWKDKGNPRPPNDRQEPRMHT